MREMSRFAKFALVAGAIIIGLAGACTACAVCVGVVNEDMSSSGGFSGTSSGRVDRVERSEQRQEAPAAVQEPIALSGSGTDTRRVSLQAGLWTVEMQVSGNVNSAFGSTMPTNFIVQMESVDGGMAMLANEIIGTWSGGTTLRVQRGGFMTLSPGAQILSVDAAGDWEIRFTKE